MRPQTDRAQNRGSRGLPKSEESSSGPHGPCSRCRLGHVPTLKAAAGYTIPVVTAGTTSQRARRSVGAQACRENSRCPSAHTLCGPSPRGGDSRG